MIIATTGSEQGRKLNSGIASKILNFNQQIDPKCNVQIPRHQQNPDRNGLTKPGSERIDKTRIKLKTFVLICMFAYILGSIREEYRFSP